MRNITSSFRRYLALQVLILASLFPGLALFPTPVRANPAGASVVHGNVAFNGLGTSQLNVMQGSQNAIINWQSFSIQSGETTNFIQPNQSSIALNRVVGADPSAIYGALNANGGVIVVNQNGIVVGPGGRVDVAGMLTMSTLDVSNEDFLDGGPMRFKGSTSAGIKNYGAITSASGDVVLLGNFLQNSGQVSAATGTVAFGAGGDIIVNQTSNGGKISVLAGGVGGDNGIENTAAGEINGAAAELKAHGNVYALAIKNDGVVRANGYNFSGGKLTLSGGSRSSVMNTGGLYARNANGSGGRVEVSGGNVTLRGGTIDASGVAGMAGGTVAVSADSIDVGNGAAVNVSGAQGGSVSLTGVTSVSVDSVISAVGRSAEGGSIDITASDVLIGSSANVDVSGSSVGGSMRVGGGYQGNEADIANADAVIVEEGSLLIADSAEGNAGRIIVWADGDTTFRGEASAQAYGQVGNGGLVEVSGKENLSYVGLVSTLSANGSNGHLLLDPTDFIIDGVGASGTTGAALLAQLAASNVVIVTSANGTENGDIVLEDGTPLIYDEANSLSLFARGNVIINDDLQNAGMGNVNLFAGWDGTGEGALVGAGTEATDLNTFDGGFSATSTPGAGNIGFADIEAGTFGDWGNGGGNILINGGGTGAVSVGSALGETNAFGDFVIVSNGDGNDRFGQLGFRDAATANGVNGAINVRAKSDVIVSAVLGDTTGNGRNDSHAMIGHGGSDNGAQATRSGVGDLAGNISVISESGGIVLQGGNDRSFAQIGHGGQNVLGGKDGNIEVSGAFLDMRGSFFRSGTNDQPGNSGTRIGHGGYFSHGDIGDDGVDAKGFSGTITVDITNSVFGSSGDPNTNNLNGSILQIGHGGYNSGVVDQDAGISDTADGAVNTNFLRDPDSYIPTNNGGGDSDAVGMDLDLAGHTGKVTVNVGGNFEWNLGGGNNTGGQVGHGGRSSHGNHAADIELNVGGDLMMLRGVQDAYLRRNDSSPFQIGNGGRSAAGAFSGNIVIDVGGSLKMEAGDSTSYVQIGHGGFADGRNNNSGADVSERLKFNQRNAQATLSGNVTVDVGGDFEMYAGSGDGNAYAMVGHGGVNRVASGVIDTLGDADDSNDVLIAEGMRGHHGNVTMDVGGSITMQGGPEDPGKFTSADGDQNNAGGNNFVQIGHGGIRSSGDHYGEVNVLAGSDIFIEAGKSGYEVLNGAGDNFNSSQTGSQSYAMIGHGGLISHLYGARDTSGNVFYQDNGNHEGVGFGVITNAQVPFGTSVTLDAAITNSNITVEATNGRIDLNAVQDRGGFRNDQRDDFDIDPTNPAPNISTRASGHFALIGHGGRGDAAALRDPADGAKNLGDITVIAGGELSVLAGKINQDDNPQLQAGDDRIEYNYAQIGHGGTDFQTDHEGEIIVDTGGDITLVGGNAYREPARIGHGGFQAGRTANDVNSTLLTGEITVTSGGSISLTGGNGQNIEAANDTQHSFAQIGHGVGAIGHTVADNITVTAARDLTLSGGQAYQDAYAHIGHGALNNGDGNFSGTIDVTAGNDILLRSTTGITVTDVGSNVEIASGATAVAVRNYAKIGHGETDSAGRTASTGLWNGDIFVKAGNDLTSDGGMIGHADPTDGDTSARSSSGDTFIAVGRNDPTGTSGNLTLGTDVGGNETVITSAGLGLSGELRFYLPTVANNAISAGSILNDPSIFGPYTRTPIPDGTRDDELVATEFTFAFDADGIPSGTFTPEGSYAASIFGFYNIYYADATSVVVGGGGGGAGVVPFTPFNVLPFFGSDQFEVYDRSDILFGFDGYDGQLYSFGIVDAVEDESDPASGGWFFEEVLDANLGSRKSSDIADDPSVIDQENDEELSRRKAFAERQAGRGGSSYYVFDPATNRYSSYRVFGVPQTNLPTAQ